MMVIVLCLCRAVMALQRVWMRQFAFSNSVIQNSTSSILFRVLLSESVRILHIIFFAFFTLGVAFCCFLFRDFALFTLYITSLCCFAFFCLLVFAPSTPTYFFAFIGSAIFSLIIYSTHFATMRVAVFFGSVFTKFRNRFDLFASSTLLCYDLLRHNRFSCKRLCSEPSIEPISMSGSLYCIRPMGGVK